MLSYRRAAVFKQVNVDVYLTAAEPRALRDGLSDLDPFPSLKCALCHPTVPAPHTVVHTTVQVLRVADAIIMYG